jgi:predicted nucleic acid-binding protein
VRKRLHAILDANVLVHDWLLESAAGRTVLAEGASGRVQLCVPEVVLREVPRVYARKLQRADRQLNEAIRDRAHLQAGAPDDALERVTTGVDVASAADAYVRALRARLDEAKVLILPVPSVPHDDIVDRALSGRRPFDQEGKTGYRDALIWQNVLDLAGSVPNIVLVSNDGDFRQSSGELHDELREEVIGSGSANRTMACCKDLSELIVRHFESESGLIYQFNERLRTDVSFFRRVREQLDRASITASPELDIDNDIDFEWTAYELDFVNDIFDDFKATFAADAGKPKAFVELAAHADVQVRYYLPVSEALDSRGLPADGVELHESRRGEVYGEYIQVVPARLSVEAFYRPGAKQLDGPIVVRIAEDWAWVEPNRVLGESPRTK